MIAKIQKAIKSANDKRETSDNGSIVIMSIFIIVVMLIFIAIATDVGAAYVKKTQMETIVQVARDANLDTAILNRNSQTPAKDIARNLTNLIRENGFNGEVEITYYELSPKEMGTTKNEYSKRVWVSRISVKDYSKNVFLPIFGYDQFELHAAVITGDENESNSKIWRPDRYGTSSFNGIWKTPANEQYRDIANNFTAIGWEKALETGTTINQDIVDYVRKYQNQADIH